MERWKKFVVLDQVQAIFLLCYGVFGGFLISSVVFQDLVVAFGGFVFSVLHFSHLYGVNYLVQRKNATAAMSLKIQDWFIFLLILIAIAVEFFILKTLFFSFT